jgi:hypothetical protein
MIMLPLYGQNTAAIKKKSVGRSDFKLNPKRHVFDKLVNIIFAELFIKIFINNNIIINLYIYIYYTNFIIIILFFKLK